MHFYMSIFIIIIKKTNKNIELSDDIIKNLHLDHLSDHILTMMIIVVLYLNTNDHRDKSNCRKIFRYYILEMIRNHIINLKWNRRKASVVLLVV